MPCKSEALPLIGSYVI